MNTFSDDGGLLSPTYILNSVSPGVGKILYQDSIFILYLRPLIRKVSLRFFAFFFTLNVKQTNNGWVRESMALSPGRKAKIFLR